LYFIGQDGQASYLAMLICILSIPAIAFLLHDNYDRALRGASRTNLVMATEYMFFMITLLQLCAFVIFQLAKRETGDWFRLARMTRAEHKRQARSR
jgi:hypothetical protein